MLIHPIKIGYILFIDILPIYFLDCSKHKKKITISAISVVNAAASCLNIGIRNKFNITLINALINVAFRKYFSSLYGINTPVPNKQARSEKRREILNICKEIVAPKYSGPAIIKIVSLLIIKRPTIAGNIKLINTRNTFSNKVLNSSVPV